MKNEVNVEISEWKDTFFQGDFVGKPVAAEKFMS